MGYFFVFFVLSGKRLTKIIKAIMTKKVTFTLAANIVADATEGLLMGDFNNWDNSQAYSLQKQKDGSMKAIVALEAGKTYQYRYLLNDGRWVNDSTAEHYAPVYGYQVENCVISVPAEEPKVAKEPAATKVAKEPKAEKAPKAPAKKAAPKAKATVEPAAADDLTKIEGIGAKIAELLAADGINTFAGLGKATAKKLKGILEAAGSKFAMHDPATWPKQAKLAAAGKWEELAQLQGQLKGGK
jgi:predicted flap endonuclease-1-like 5' DNA nuclease